MILPYLSILILLITCYLTYHLLPTYHLLLSSLSLLTFIHELFCINNYMNNKYNRYTISIIVSVIGIGLYRHSNIGYQNIGQILYRCNTNVWSRALHVSIVRWQL